MLLAQNNPQEPQDLGVDIPANFPFLISILQFKIRNFPNPVPNHNVSPFSAVTGKANQRSINYSRLSPEQAVLLFQLVVRKECTLSAPPPPPATMGCHSMSGHCPWTFNQGHSTFRHQLNRLTRRKSW